MVKSVGKILELLKEYPDMTRERLAAEVGLSVRGVEKNLAQLKSAGRIRRIGGRKGGRWEVIRNAREATDVDAVEWLARQVPLVE